MGDIMVAWIETDWRAALEVLRAPEASGIALGNGDPLRGGLGEHLRAPAIALAKADVQAALDWIANDIPVAKAREDALVGLITQLGHDDPAVGRGILDKETSLPGNTRRRLFGELAEGDGWESRQAATEWALTQAPDVRLDALKGALTRSSYNVPPDELVAAAELVAEADPSAFEKLLPDLSWRLIRADPDKFAELTADVPLKSLAKIVSENATMAHSLEDCLATAVQIDAIGVDSESGAFATQFLTQRWTARDPAGARRWVEALPPGEARDYALGNLVNAWEAIDLAAATRWFDAQPSDSLPERARLAMAENLLTTAPEMALAVAAASPDTNTSIKFIKRNAAVLLALAPESLRQIDDQDTRETFANTETWHAFLRAAALPAE
ncbi:hypothetical protein BH23VER1_BH23VER1_14680 [soil metagenome]